MTGRQAVAATLLQFAVIWRDLMLRAYSFGGHAFHGGPTWPARKDPEGPPLGGPSGRIAQGTQTKVAGNKLSLMNTSELAGYHQNGTQDIPARPVVVLTRPDIEQVKAMLKRNVEAALNGSV